MPALNRIVVKGFKSIKSLNLQLGQLNIFIGANGSGKTNFIQLFRLLNQIVNGNLQLYVGKRGGSEKLLYYGAKITEAIEIYAEFSGEKANLFNTYKCTLIPNDEDRFVFGQEEIGIYDTKQYHDSQNFDFEIREDMAPYLNPLKYDLGKGHFETKLLETKLYGDDTTYKSPNAEQVIDAINSWQVYHFHDTSDNAAVKKIGNIHDNEFLRPDASNLAAYLYLLKNKYPSHYRNIIDAIRSMAPFFNDFNLRPLALNEEKIRLEWYEKGSDMYFNASHLSDGTLRFICLVTLLLQPKEMLPATILLDEPELGLHPYAINLLVGLLESVSHHTQVIVSTQSVTLVNQCYPEDIVIVERENGESIFTRLDEEDIAVWLEDYALGELWEKNIIGGRP